VGFADIVFQILTLSLAEQTNKMLRIVETRMFSDGALD